MSSLFLFYLVNPLVGKLLELVASINIVEDCELRSEHEGKVAGLDETDIPGDQELVMEDHTTEPFVVRPAAKSRDSSNRSDVCKEENKSATRP